MEKIVVSDSSRDGSSVLCHFPNKMCYFSRLKIFCPCSVKIEFWRSFLLQQTTRFRIFNFEYSLLHSWILELIQFSNFVNFIRLFFMTHDSWRIIVRTLAGGARQPERGGSWAHFSSTLLRLNIHEYSLNIRLLGSDQNKKLNQSQKFSN